MNVLNLSSEAIDDICRRLTDGRFCRLVDHWQGNCDCQEIADFVRTELYIKNKPLSGPPAPPPLTCSGCGLIWPPFAKEHNSSDEVCSCRY